ncbi:hypothetical protein ACHHYP_00955 [Achlya hypogyna]|uniref:Transmembrane protein n=1 Tax=Achlya hypogyna TaxID=1202772 RepID=A0A1V9Z9P6_ACHHY|nr:hypothetical protein ACHHYP_00955 [Achlya hypogyna]
MPLKAYISEPFPSQSYFPTIIPANCQRNFTACAPQLLAFFEAESQRLSPTESYTMTKSYDIFRTPVELQHGDPDNYYLHLPFGVFFSSTQREMAAELALGARNFPSFRTVAIVTCLGNAIGYTTRWGNIENGTTIIYSAFVRVESSSWWLSGKLLYRVVLAGTAARAMWQQYFAQYAHLEANLRLYGLPGAPAGSVFQVIVGDPSSLVLQNPRFTLALALDFWMSVDYAAHAFNRLLLAPGALSYFAACLYLSRTVWFGYGALILTSCILKLVKGHRFYALDSTAVAFALTIVAGPFTELQITFPALGRIYNKLFTTPVANADHIEVSLAALVYTLVIGAFPVLFGLTFPRCSFGTTWGSSLFTRSMSGGPRVAPSAHGSYTDNDLKNRCTMWLNFVAWTRKKQTAVGGSIYDLFCADPRYMMNQCLSLRGTDAYVVFNTGNCACTSVRLSLLVAIDIHKPLRVVPGYVDLRSDRVVRQGRYCVRLNKRSILMSCLMVLNIMIMLQMLGPAVADNKCRPLKAYISEPLPWTSVPMEDIPLTCYLNFTACTPILLSVFQNHSRGLTSSAPYLSNSQFDLIRVPQPPLSPPSEASTYYLGLPYGMFYSVQQQALLQQIVRRQMNASAFATAEITYFCGMAISYNVIWIDAGGNDTYIMYLGGARAAMSLQYQWAKLAYRLFLVTYLLWYMWRKYFCHYRSLMTNLEQFGIVQAPLGTTFEIVVGDPTSIVLANPLVALAFVLDFWMSSDFVARAFMRVGQVVAIEPFLTASLYLSRTLWFAYGSLVVTSHTLKRCGLARHFHSVDPTLTAIAVVIVVGPFTYVQTNIPFFAKLYNTLFLASPTAANAIEIGPPALIYTSLIGGLPLAFGFRPPCPFRRPRDKSGPVASLIDHASILHNDMKSRWAVMLSLFTWKTTTRHLEGGGIYGLFARDPKYKSTLGISQRGSDCYMLYRAGAQIRGLRLSLIQCIDVQSPLEVLSTTVPAAFGRICVEKDQTTIVRGSNHSPWLVLMRAWTSGSIVAPVDAPARYTVRYNRRSVVLSFLLMLNVLVMPMKAYISEPVPWSSQRPATIPSDCHVNFTACTPFVLNFFHNESARLLTAETPHVATDMYDLVRIPFPLPAGQDPHDYALKMPYALFYSAEQKLLAARLSLGRLNASAIQTGEMITFLGTPIGYTALWTAEANSSNLLFIGFARASTTASWLGGKFAYRVMLSWYLAWCVYMSYYRHYRPLCLSLARLGLSSAPPQATLHLVVGDPTSIVLLNPWVAVFFVADFWMSADFVSLAFLRVAEITSLQTFFIASLYLSRTLWFAYAGLGLFSSLLKRLGKELWLSPIDPTLTAIVVILAAGPFTTLQTRVPFLVELYNYVFNNLAEAPNEIESGVAAIVYSLLIGGLPVFVGVLRAAWIHRRHTSLKGPHAAYIDPASYLENDVKTRWAVALSVFSRRRSVIEATGGSVYDLLMRFPALQKHLGMSQRGGDCYVLYDDGNGRSVSVRLSLVSCIDVKPPLVIAPPSHSTAVGRIDMTKRGPMLVPGAANSMWLM